MNKDLGIYAELKQKILEIEQRNVRVEAKKAWEISTARKIVIFILTYVFAVFWLYSIHESNIWLKAFVPAVGYLISTFSLSWAKSLWQKNQNH